MHYKIVKENKPNLKNYGRFKAVAVHYNTIRSVKPRDTGQLFAKEERRQSRTDRAVRAAGAPPTGWRPRQTGRHRTAEDGDRERQGGQGRGLQCAQAHP